MTLKALNEILSCYLREGRKKKRLGSSGKLLEEPQVHLHFTENEVIYIHLE